MAIIVAKIPVPIQRAVNPNLSAIKVPKYGVTINAMENEIPFKPIYDPLLFLPDLRAVIVDINGNAQISPTHNKLIETIKVKIL